MRPRITEESTISDLDNALADFDLLATVTMTPGCVVVGLRSPSRRQRPQAIGKGVSLAEAFDAALAEWCAS